MSDPSAAEAPAIVDQAYVTLVTSDEYALGACVLGHSLRRSGTRRELVVLVSSGVTPLALEWLHDVFDTVKQVEPIDSGDAARLALLQRPELGITFTKLQLWTLTAYKRCVYLDADTLVLQNVDDLFETYADATFAAAPDVGWPDIFNSGVFVFVPSQETYDALSAMATTEGSFDGGDQGLLNQFFSGWSRGGRGLGRLPFTYNTTANTSYMYAPAYERFKNDVKIVHFIGPQKPWRGMPRPGQGIHGLMDLVEKWWNMHDDYVSCCSESAPYKTLVGSKPRSRSGSIPSLPTGGGGEVRRPEDNRKPLVNPDTQFLSSVAASEVETRIKNLASGAYDTTSNGNGKS